MNAEEIESIFDAIDTNKDGTISVDEARHGLKELGIPFTVSALERFVASVDADRDGRITRAEFVAFVILRQEKLKKTFEAFDVSKTNSITRGDLREVCSRMGIQLSSSELDGLIELGDVDQDGSLSASEFSRLMMLLSDVHVDGVFEQWIAHSAIEGGETSDVPAGETGLPVWVSLVSGAVAGAVSRTLTAPLDRIRTMLQAGTPDLVRKRPLYANMSASSSVTYYEWGRYRQPETVMEAAARRQRRDGKPLNSKLTPLPRRRRMGAKEWTEGVKKSAPPLPKPVPSREAVVRRIRSAAAKAAVVETALPGRAASLQGGRRRDKSVERKPAKAPVVMATKSRARPRRQPRVSKAVAFIAREGGMQGFWRGNGTNLIKIIPETAVRFGAYEAAKRMIAKDPTNVHPMERFLAGGLAGVVATVTIYPLEIAKTRMALATTGQFHSILHCMRDITRVHGPRSLYQGMGASLLGIIPYSGTELMTYTLLRDAWIARYPDVEPSTPILLACGATASTVGQLVAYPLQLVRTRLQAQGMPQRPVVFNGVIDCFKKTVVAEGVPGLYRGIFAGFLKSIPACMITFATFEKTKEALKIALTDRNNSKIAF